MSLLVFFPCLQGPLVNFLLKNRVQPAREAIPKTPADYGMPVFKSVDIQSLDGVRLSAWVIESENSDKLCIVNHPLLCTRYGSLTGLDGVKVNFLPLLKQLHDDGFTILTYDQRGQGESDGNQGKYAKGKEAPVGAGAVEWQDIAGVLNFVKNDDKLSKLNICLLTQCMGANATFVAWNKVPEVFGDKVKCQAAIQPTISQNLTGRMTKIKLGRDIAASIDDACQKKYGFKGVDSTKYVGDCKVPVFFLQMKNDVYSTDTIRGQDVQRIYDACPTEKELVWIGPGTENPHMTGKRFEGYSFLNEHPEKLLAFFNKHVSA